MVVTQNRTRVKTEEKSLVTENYSLIYEAWRTHDSDFSLTVWRHYMNLGAEPNVCASPWRISPQKTCFASP